MIGSYVAPASCRSRASAHSAPHHHGHVQRPITVRTSEPFFTSEARAATQLALVAGPRARPVDRRRDRAARALLASRRRTSTDRTFDRDLGRRRASRPAGSSAGRDDDGQRRARPPLSPLRLRRHHVQHELGVPLRDPGDRRGRRLDVPGRRAPAARHGTPLIERRPSGTGARRWTAASTSAPRRTTLTRLAARECARPRLRS